MATKRKSNLRKRLQRARKTMRFRSRKAVVGKRTREPRFVYYFGDGHADGRGTQKALLGGKGANLHEMTRIGLPVPPGFSITTEVCTYYYENKKTYPKALTEQVNAALAKLEGATGKKFGDKQNPLLVSVRSGAR